MHGYKGKTNAWAIVHDRGLMHTNWLLGVGEEAWPGAFVGTLFTTRSAARDAIKAARGYAVAANGWSSGLPFTPRVVKVAVVETRK